VKRARKELGLKGFVPIKKGSKLYNTAKKISQARLQQISPEIEAPLETSFSVAQASIKEPFASQIP
jgi:hypothetical protein